MIRTKQNLLIIFILMMVFFTSCAGPDIEENIEKAEVDIEKPVVKLENSEQGVLITWNEIPNVEGYYIYSRYQDQQYNRIATVTDSTVLEYVDFKALVKTNYYYAVRAFRGEQKSDFDEVIITTEIWQPKIEVTYTNPSMDITWNQIYGSDGYIIYRKEEGGEYSRIYVIEDAKHTSYKDEEVLPGKIYTYAVRAYIGEERSSYTSVTSATISEPIVEVENTGESVIINWNEIEEAEGYFVYRKTEGGEYQILQKIEDTASTTYIDRDLSYGTKYYYAVRAYLGEQKSSYSPVDIVADLGRVSVSIEAVDSGVQLEWNKIDSAEGYYVYKKEEGDEEYSLVNAITDASIVSYLDQQVESGKTYYYAVRAFLGEEQSRYSGGTVTIANN